MGSNKKKVTSFFNADKEISNSIRDNKILNEKIQALYSEINKLNKELKNSNKKILDKDQTINNLKGELNNSKILIDSLTSELNNIKEEINGFKELNKSRLSTIGDLYKRLEANNHERTKLLERLKAEERAREAERLKVKNIEKPKEQPVNIQKQTHKVYQEDLVSVIIPSYNTRDYICKAVDSVLNQTYDNIEILIVDDNSQDDTLEVLKKYLDNPKVHIYKSPVNVGPYFLKNYMLDRMRGKYFTILDSDDTDVPTKIEKQVAQFKKNPNIKCVTCSYLRNNSKASLGWPAMMYSREVFENIGYYDSVRFAADSEFYYRFKKYYGSSRVEVHINEVLQKGPRRSDGITGLNPEGSSIRKKYVESFNAWHKTSNLKMPFNPEERPFVVPSEMLNKKIPNLYELEKIEKPTDFLPVVMCVWKRIDGLKIAVEQFNNQTFKNFKLFIWNNNPDYSIQFESILTNTAKFEWEIHHSSDNIGGFGRFYFARKLRRTPGLSNWVVFVDDDQRWGKDMLSVLWSERAEKTILSQFGWKFNGDDYYRDRVQCLPGETIHYAGTGGMIVHNPIFDDPMLYVTHPEDWWVEDLWLSYWANHQHGYELLKSAAQIKNGDDEHSLYKRVKDTKTPMLRRLLDKGKWNILNSPKPLISTIMVSYLGDYPGSRTNPVPKFNRAVQSWVDQTLTNKELIIVSDGCELTNREYNDNWANNPQIKLLQPPKNPSRWPGSYRQKGVDAATGDWITYLDSDDILLPDYLQGLVPHLGSNNYIVNQQVGQALNINPINKHGVVDINIIGKPVRLKEPNLPQPIPGTNLYWATRPSNSRSWATHQLIHHRSIPQKWTDQDRRGEDIQFSKQWPKPMTINQPGYIICHLNNHLDL